MPKKENSTENRSGYFITAPIHFGEPEVQKRFAIVILRTSQGDVTLKKGVTAYDVTLSRTLDAGVGVNAIDIEAEVRYSHRRRIKRTEVVRTM